ncbi:calcitonin gene-related peptide type 1 receptor isoform X1 [Nilaparvata lugens]|uniref:calcitonin gene-related peptide type 1 receptor isoform X1 n=1 Tax=Nilaparvata lugens TaxID=108931 RepID=UPI00193CFCC2|nr:calcitonin gene-related peptide type 1 receptor isoform X1 [Nilaparvata lugens]
MSPEQQNASLRFFKKLKEDCDHKRRLKLVSAAEGVTEIEELQCPAVFDGFTCWDATPAGENAFAPCPDFVTGFEKTRFAFRSCMENGTWFRHPQTGKYWSNYTTCVDMEDLEFREFVNSLYVTGYSVSSAALLISLLIFLTFRLSTSYGSHKYSNMKQPKTVTYHKSLRCTRIAIHVHLFVSFAANNLMWIVWYKQVVGVTKVVQENDIYCQALHIILQYLMVANYMWMFCEGLHLHLALVVVFVKDDCAMRLFYFIGWCLPLFITTVYTLVRMSYPHDTSQCWMGDSYSQWVLIVPVLLSMLASLAFLINVVRVLLTKLHCNSANPAPIGMRKAVRAALILIPLFGIHHILIPFRPEPHAPLEMTYQIFSALLVSLQGFCVSVLFCFANVDVHCAFKNVLRRMRRRRAGDNNGTVTQQTQTREMV